MINIIILINIRPRADHKIINILITYIWNVWRIINDTDTWFKGHLVTF